MLKNILSRVIGDPNQREIERLQPIVERINGLEEEYSRLSDAELRALTDQFRAQIRSATAEDLARIEQLQRELDIAASRDERERLQDQVGLLRKRIRQSEEEVLNEILPHAFAAVREASKRTIGLRHFDVQLIGGIVLHQGKIAEMKTGEGKTLVATLPLYLNALLGHGAHLVTVNEYLARRDCQWMGPIYDFLGLSVGLLQPGEKAAFLFDREWRGGSEDTRCLRPVSRAEAYRADITYGTNHEFGFDYLRDNMAWRLEDRVQRELHYAIVDEVDNILIDEARTPLIISAPSDEPAELYSRLAKLVKRLNPGDYEIDEKTRTVILTDQGYDHVEQLLGRPLQDPNLPEMWNPEEARLMHHLEQALKAQYLFQVQRDYIVRGGQVILVDEFTGRLMPGRRYSDGLHQAIEAKENVKVRQESVTYATITLQNYFRLYAKLAGMTGTAATEAEEFNRIYKLEVVVIPTNEPMIRQDYLDVIYKTEEAKFNAVVEEIAEMRSQGRPVLVGTLSIEKSERLSAMLKQRGIDHQVLNAKYHAREAAIIAQAGRRGAVTIATNMAGRGVDIKLGGGLPEEDAALINRFLVQWGHDPVEIYTMGLEARASLFCEELYKPEHWAECVGPIYVQKLGRLIEQPANFEERRLALEAVATAEAMRLLRIIEHVENRREVLRAGGLHVIGTERHEARRIDNQLRGRAGRQGEPGSSRFFISLEDDLMRRAGGDRVTSLMDRLGGYPDDMPLEYSLLNKVIEDTQTRIEGYNFDIRKHLVEYDDVLNAQREVIYEQRRRILSRHDLRADVMRLLEEEIDRLLDAYWGSGREWQLLYSLDTILPPLNIGEKGLFPSFTIQAFLNYLNNGHAADLKSTLVDVSRSVMERYSEYIVEDLVRPAIERTIQAYQERLRYYQDVAETHAIGLLDEAMERGQAITPARLLREVGAATGLPLEISADLRGIEGEDLHAYLPAAVEAALKEQARQSMLSAVKRRSGLQFDFQLSRERDVPLEELGEVLITGIHEVLKQNAVRTTEQVANELKAVQWDGGTHGELMQALFNICYNVTSEFDTRTHKRVYRLVPRIPLYHAAPEILENVGREELRQSILNHFEAALDAREAEWGTLELRRIGHLTPDQLDADLRFDMEHFPGIEFTPELARTPITDLPSEMQGAIAGFLGRRIMTRLQQQIMLGVIGRLWVDYLNELEALREGIGLQAIAQRDPLAEYKRRAYDLFQALLTNVRVGVLNNLFRAWPAGLEDVARPTKPTTRTARAPAEKTAEAARAEITNGLPETKRVGRNDPCPCGSGKKYKNCCLRRERKKSGKRK